MKNIFSFFVLLFTTLPSFGQSVNKRYVNDIFTTVGSVMTVEYGQNLNNYTGQTELLLADIYSPKDDTLKNRAMIIFVHGGGFAAGGRNSPAASDICIALAKKGYVSASIDYRLGVDKMNVRSIVQGLIRSVQDINAFVRYSKAHADSLEIDTNKIFISGASAGGLAVLAKAYIKIDSVAAKLGITSLNDLEGSDNDLPNTSSIAGVYSMWGAIVDTSWIQAKDPPVGCIHSIDDHTIPYVSGSHNGDTEFTLYGSYSIYTRARNVGILTTIHAYNSGQHDLGIKAEPYKDTTIQLMSEFFSQIIDAYDKSDSLQQKKEENTFLQKTYLVKTEVTDEKESMSHLFAMKKEYLLMNDPNVQGSDTTEAGICTMPAQKISTSSP
jgi:acetyl esterase/lipase